MAPLLVLLFIWLTSFLLTISWIHVNILGGVLLLYVNYNMLHHDGNKNINSESNSGITLPILSIIAADLTLSLENSISILSIVSKSGAMVGGKEIGQIVVALLVGIPILLLLGQTISKLLDRYSIITNLCAGYLTFMAMQMIFADESICEFLHAIRFTLTTFISILIGILVAASSIFISSQRQFGTRKRRKGMIILGTATIAYSLFTIIRITYLNTNPIIDGVKFHAEQVLGFTPSGANAIYALSIPPHLFPIFMIFLSGMIYETSASKKMSFNLFIHKYRQSLFCMLLLIISYTAICMIGITNNIGFGVFNPWSLVSFLSQIFIMAIYLAIFFFIRSLSRIKAVGTFGCLMFILLENLLFEVFWHVTPLHFFIILLPDYYAHILQTQLESSVIPFQLLLVGIATIAGTLWAGGSLFSKVKNIK